MRVGLTRRSGQIAVAAWAAANLCVPCHAAGRSPGTVEEVLRRYRPAVAREFTPICRRAGIGWPPRRVTLLAFKSERVLEVWGAGARGLYRLIGTFPILAASGTVGPKRQEGDMQVPEGFYRITALNPASRFHLSFRVDYPNAEDTAHAVVPRNRLGGDIYVHGNHVSAGCIAIGDAAIEKVFCLVALAQPAARRILIAPVDFRRVRDFDAPADQPHLRDLYRRLRRNLQQFKGVRREA